MQRSLDFPDQCSCVTSAGRELNAEDILPAQKLFLELINESSDFQSQRGEPWPSVGDFLRAQVHFWLCFCPLQISCHPLVASRFSHELWVCFFACYLVQVQQHAAEKWKDVDEATRSLRLCVISNMLKVECCVNGTHTMDEVSMGAFGVYKTLPGLDCTFPGFVLLTLCKTKHLSCQGKQANSQS